MSLAISTSRTPQDLRRSRRRRRHRSRRAARQLLRLPRAERRRQVHDDQVPDGSAAADGRHVSASSTSIRLPIRSASSARSASCPRTWRCSIGSPAPRRSRSSARCTASTRPNVRERSAELLDADGSHGAPRAIWSPTTRTACARRSRSRRRCCRRRACCSSTSRSRASTRSRRGRSRTCCATFVRDGGTVFLTSHILEIVERLCDHIGIIQRGPARRAGIARGAARRRRPGASLEETVPRARRRRAAQPALDWLG